MKALVSEFNKTFPDCWDWNCSASNTTYSLTKVNYRTKVNELLAKIIACNMVASAWVHILRRDEHIVNKIANRNRDWMKINSTVFSPNQFSSQLIEHISLTAT